MLGDESLDMDISSTLEEAQALTKQTRIFYNTKRPHSAHGYRPPAPEALLSSIKTTAHLVNTIDPETARF